MIDKDSERTSRQEDDSRSGRKFAVRAGTRPALVRDPSRHYRLHRCLTETGNATDCDVVMSQSAYQRIMKHLEAETTREHGGLLLGHVCRSGNSTPPTILITTSLPAEYTEGNPTRLTFSEDTWLSFQQDTDEMERLGVKLQRLGWYHSHPGIEIFLSHWDLDVCSNFDLPHQVALVVDPIGNCGGFFIRGERGYRPHEPRGFWEYPDLKSESLVQWQNTYEVRRDWLIPANELLAVEVIEERVEVELTHQPEPQPEPASQTEPASEPESAGGPAPEAVPALSEVTGDRVEIEGEARASALAEGPLDQSKYSEQVKVALVPVNEPSSSAKAGRGPARVVGRRIRKLWGLFIGVRTFSGNQKRGGGHITESGDAKLRS